MSLIIDALKRAQELRLNGAQGPPILNYPYPNKKMGRISKKHWIPVGVGLISLCIVLIVFLRPASSPLTTQTNPAIVPVERERSVSVAEKMSSEPPKEVLGLVRAEETPPAGSSDISDGAQADQSQKPVNSITEPGKAVNPGPGGTGSAEKREKKPSETKTSTDGKRSGSLKKQAPPPLAAQKEDKPLKSIEVEQEGGKSGALTSDVLNHFNAGVTFYNQREFSKAIQAYQKVIELDPVYVEAYNNLGILLLLKGRDEEALEAFRKALAINPNNIETHINLGTLFKKKGQWDEAIESYQKALAIDPFHKETHYNIALLYEQMEKLELAISHYQQFVRLSSRSHPELVLRVQRHLNDLMKAKK